MRMVCSSDEWYLALFELDEDVRQRCVPPIDPIAVQLSEQFYDRVPDLSAVLRPEIP